MLPTERAPITNASASPVIQHGSCPVQARERAVRGRGGAAGARGVVKPQDPLTAASPAVKPQPDENDWRLLGVRFRRAHAHLLAIGKKPSASWELIQSRVHESGEGFKGAWRIVTEFEKWWLEEAGQWRAPVLDDFTIDEQKGVPAEEAAAWLGVDDKELRRQRLLRGLRAEDGLPEGSPSVRDREIRIKHARGESQRALAKEYGVTQARVCQIVNGKR